MPNTKHVFAIGDEVRGLYRAHYFAKDTAAVSDTPLCISACASASQLIAKDALKFLCKRGEGEQPLYMRVEASDFEDKL